MSDPLNPQTNDDTFLMEGTVTSIAVEAIGTPSVHDTSWAQVVSWPWPCGEVPVLTVTVPSSLTVQVPISTPRPVSST